MNLRQFHDDIDPARTALVVIECQNEWLSPKGKLQTLRHADSLSLFSTPQDHCA